MTVAIASPELQFPHPAIPHPSPSGSQKCSVLSDWWKKTKKPGQCSTCWCLGSGIPGAYWRDGHRNREEASRNFTAIWQSHFLWIQNNFLNWRLSLICLFLFHLPTNLHPSPQLYWGVIGKWKFLYLRYTTWCFDIHIHCEMIATIKPINISISSHGHDFFVWWDT